MENPSDLNFEAKQPLALLEKQTKPKISLDFELWEILTAFTLAFTLASVLIWFSNLQPKQLQNEFISIEQNKNSIYNLSLQIDNINSTKSNLIATQKSENSCQDSLEINKNEQKADEANFQKIDNNFSNIQNSNKESVVLIQSDPSFSTLKQNFQDYFLASKSFKNQNLEIGKKLTAFNDTFSMLCDEKPEYSSNYLASTRDLQASIDSYSSENLASTKKALSDLNDILSTKETMESDFLRPEIVASLIKNSSIVYNLKDVDFMEQTDIKQTKNNLFQNLKKLEDWQKTYVAKNPPLKEKVVFIFDAKA